MHFCLTHTFTVQGFGFSNAVLQACFSYDSSHLSVWLPGLALTRPGKG